MRGTDHFKKHMSVRVQVDGETTDNIPIEDPFHHTTVRVGISFWNWLKLLVKRPREIEVRVKIIHDGVALGRWFQGADICEKCKRARIDDARHGPHADPGYHHGDERWCEACYYDYPINDQTMRPHKGEQQGA